MDSKIDWTKPLQIADGDYDTRGGMPVTVISEDGGNRLIQWAASAGKCNAFVSEQGKLIATLHTGAAICPGKQQFVENVPEVAKVEPPKDTLVMFRPKEGDRWFLMFEEAKTRECAAMEANAVSGPCDYETKLVTVPTGSKLVQSIAQPLAQNLLLTAIKYVRLVGQNTRTNKLGCDGVADMYERVCQAAEQYLGQQSAKKDASTARAA